MILVINFLINSWSYNFFKKNKQVFYKINLIKHVLNYLCSHSTQNTPLINLKVLNIYIRTNSITSMKNKTKIGYFSSFFSCIFIFSLSCLKRGIIDPPAQIFLHLNWFLIPIFVYLTDSERNRWIGSVHLITENFKTKDFNVNE